MATEITVNVTEGPTPTSRIIQFVGEMDESNLDQIRESIQSVLGDSNIKTLLFDLTGLQFINSKGIGYLVSVHTHLSKDQRSMLMAGANEAVMDVISLVGLTSIIPHYQTLDEARQQLTA